MKKNQERRLHRKNAKIVKEGGTPMQLNRPVKPDTTVSFRSLFDNSCTDIQLLFLATMWSLRSDGAHEFVHVY